ncbi:MAG: histidine--tRNA ligase [Comamonas sp.]|nr:histidine--tRNA ligase [Comamonas sp.]
MTALKAVKGMNDILPGESERWQWLEAQVREVMDGFAYRNARMPIVEHTQLFVRGIGEVTDIVEKEMYSFEDKLNGEHLTLRPEGTASLVRATVEHNLLYDGGKRMWYMGPMFRHERPQRGRYRQFHQIGAEALGFAGAEVDAELILLAITLFERIGLQPSQWRLEINSLGQPAERQAHRAALIAYLEQHQEQLDEPAKRRMYANPLRVLDTKNPAMQALANAAPKLLDYLGEESLAHFEQLKALLDANGVAWTVNPRLVRGLDYYNLSVFEFVTDLLGAQGTICAGGRYDYLVEQIGGKGAPAVGWALGVERVLELVKELGTAIPQPRLDAYAIVPDAAALPQALQTVMALRRAGVAVQMHASGKDGLGSMKSQFKKADASGAHYALIFGGDELARGEVTVKALRQGGAEQGADSPQDRHQDSQPQQQAYPLADVAQWAPRLQ